MRKENSIKNIITAMIGQVFGVIIGLIGRFVFVKILSKEYLGLNGLFTNILTILSLVELGVGSAITYSLYKPLAEKNTEKIKSLMNIYKKLYIIIGVAIFILGMCLIPFLPKLINEMPQIDVNINLVYALFVINTACSYFFSYKKTLIVSDQKKYIATICKYISFFALNVVQIVILLISKDYIAYLIAQIIFTIIENLMISKEADKLYPYLKENNAKPLIKQEKKEIKKNIGAIILHKIGGVVVNATDNLVIAKYVGLGAVGLYSNYYLITNALQLTLSQFFTSTTASIGNLAITDNKEKLYDIFKKIYFMNYWIYSFVSICLFVIFNDFINVWIGNEFIIDMPIVFVIVLNFFIAGMRKTVLTFRDALGLYYQDRKKPVVESIVNLVISIILAKKYGIIGVFIGTTISTLGIAFWWESLILYKYGLKENVVKYYGKTIIYFITALTTGSITFILANLLFKDANIINLIGKLAVCVIIPNMIYYCLYRKNSYFTYFKQIFINVKRRHSFGKDNENTTD